MRREFCPHCRRPLPLDLPSCQLPRIKARIYDLVVRSGDAGVTADRLNALVWDGRARPELVRQHIHQLNQLLEGTGLQVRNRDRYAYRLVPSGRVQVEQIVHRSGRNCSE